MTENTMTLEQVRDWHREQSKKNRLRIPPNYEEALPHEDMADAIDRHLTGPCSPNYRKSAFLIGFEFARDAHLSRPVSMSDEDVERACKTIFPRTWDAYGKVVDDPRTANVRAALEADRAGRGVDLRAELELLVADMLQPHAFTPAHYARQIEKMLAQGNGGVRDAVSLAKELRMTGWVEIDDASFDEFAMQLGCMITASTQPDVEGG